VHELLEGTPGLAVLYLLGAPAPVYAAAIAVVTLHLFLQHANIDYRLGILRHVIAGAELHRWHHQRRWQAVQGNYAAVLAIWDHLFRSSLGDRGAAPPDVGMDDEPDLPANYLGQLAWPFRAPGSIRQVPLRERGDLGGSDSEHATKHP
jgi:sterol desaturase/sphingolipid hydroxylase (fatty acid hydroxylase superfamily)